MSIDTQGHRHDQGPGWAVSPGARLPHDEPSKPAGFWRRFWAHWLDVWLAASAVGTIQILLVWIGAVATDAFQHCSLEDGRNKCTASPAVLPASGAVTLLVTLVVLAFILIRPLSHSRPSFGMRQLGLRVVDNVERHRVVHPALRGALPFTLALMSALGPTLFVAVTLVGGPFRDGDHYDGIVDVVSTVLLVATVVVGLVIVVDAVLVVTRRQSILDTVSSTTMVEYAEPSWLAMLSVLVSLLCLAPFVVLMAAQFSDQRFITRATRRPDLDLLLSSLRVTGDPSGHLGLVLLIGIPVVFAAAVAIAVSRYAAREIRDSRPQLAGSKLAGMGMFLGVVPILLTGFWLTTTVLNSRITRSDRRACGEERRLIEQAVQSFNSLNEKAPSSIDDLQGDIYLNDDTLADRWRLGPNGPVAEGRCTSD
ncbi:MAG: RDD family protein [Microthrixaceae bacterium]